MHAYSPRYSGAEAGESLNQSLEFETSLGNTEKPPLKQQQKRVQLNLPPNYFTIKE